MAGKRTQGDDGNAAPAQPIAAEDGVLYSHDVHILDKSTGRLIALSLHPKMISTGIGSTKRFFKNVKNSRKEVRPRCAEVSQNVSGKGETDEKLTGDGISPSPVYMRRVSTRWRRLRDS